MFTPPGERFAALDASAERLGAAVRARAAAASEHPDDFETAVVGEPAPSESYFVGRVCLDALDGKLNKSSVVLEGSRADGGRRARLDLTAAEKSYAIFPGQIVGVRGSAPGEDGTIVARELTLGAPPPPPRTARRDLAEYHAEAQKGHPVSAWVAAGPFTTSDSLEYAPLTDLLAAVAKHKPDVVILLGPFVDADHPRARRAALDADGDDEPVDAATLFVLKIAWALDRLGEEGCPTQFVLVPSTRDLVAEPVFPQPPLARSRENGPRPSWQDEFPVGSLELPASNAVHLVGNPGLFAINEVVVGCMATDVLFQLSSTEVFENCRDGSALAAAPRVARLATHLLDQRSFFPLFPPPVLGAAHADAPVDLRQHDKWALPLRPDVLVTPSRLQPFARDVGGTLVLNPGHLAKNTAGGTFAQLTVHGMAAADDGADGAEALHHAVPARSRVEITRI